MPDLEDLVIPIFILVFIFYQIISFIDRKKKEKEFRENNSELKVIRDGEIGKSPPQHIKASLDEYIQDYRSNGIVNWNDFSPLACFGYRVGKTNGKRESIRREIIHYTWYAQIPSIIPYRYAVKWGDPGTCKRFDKIRSHLLMLGRQRQSRKNYEVAVQNWFSDAEWFQKKYWSLACRYRDYGFSG